MFQSDDSCNRLGTFSFNSVEDFAANRPSSFSRTLTQPDASGSAWNSAVAFSHQWAPTRFFSLLYGARVEANGFGDKPPVNSALEQALGVHTGVAPTMFHVSPRVGFSYTYNRDRDNGGADRPHSSTARSGSEGSSASSRAAGRLGSMRNIPASVPDGVRRACHRMTYDRGFVATQPIGRVTTAFVAS
jgi:hypothetical protein